MDSVFKRMTWENGVRFMDNNSMMILLHGENIGTMQRGTSFVFVFDGFAQVMGKYGTIMLQSGMYGCFYEGTIRTFKGSMVFMVRVDGYAGFFSIGGPLEQVGRLKYINGCTDSILVPPVRKGDPCLNHLHFPVGINQTMHTHPEVRIGIVAKGYGKCVTDCGEYDLVPGLPFVILPNGRHCFKTNKHPMDIVAFHPVSDVGPTDEEHPMISKTIVEGVKASEIPDIMTV